MAVFTRPAFLGLAVVILSVLAGAANAQLSPNFYSTSCPGLAGIVRSGMASAVQTEKRMAASIVRLFFHDCFVNGCDGSILLDDTSTFTGEKNAGPNANSARGYEVIDAIKTQVEAACKATVSCADILALAARDGVNLVGGPTWNVPLGRKDSRTASQSAANSNLPGPGSSLATLISMFGNKNLSPQDMTALSGAHTIGRSQCQFFRNRIYTETNINASFATLRQGTCPRSGGDSNLAPFDVRTADGFDNAYYQNLVEQRGLLHSDQELFNGGSQDALVRQYSNTPSRFSADFATAMVKMGNLLPTSGTQEIRLNCRKPN
ncbi:peroxidase P7-like [Lolium rigidum]|uniref:peroxidase P7-like n=1 Tax=Lolium rigidum TaxID=89674 RepID=UPI001F5C3059|nr:peroxidase P7-like [Lolium rigidum]XP_051200526.1 peroxidase P7-like [Lolium perenne]